VKKIHVEHYVQTKERKNVEIKRIIPHSLGDSVWPIIKWVKLPMGSCKALLQLPEPVGRCVGSTQ
jgi:hypothetical protein